MKRCPKCEKEQPLGQFGRDRSRRDGLQVWCKSCQRSYRQSNKDQIAEGNKQWKKDNPEKVKRTRDRNRSKPEVKEARARYNKQWKKDNPEKVRDQQRMSYQRHAQKRRDAAKRYAQANPEKVRQRQRKWRDRNTDHVKAYRKRNRHKDREYYSRNSESIRRKKEQRRKWVVYRIEFLDGSFYLGSSCHADLRFNAHKSLAGRGIHTEPLQEQDFEGASWKEVSEHPSEESALEAEATQIQAAWDAGSPCLNKTLPSPPKSLFWVYVIQSLKPRTGGKGQALPGFFYVGMTTEPSRRLREHNGLYADGRTGNPNGGKYTSKHRPWEARALFGPYFSRSEALRAEYALKRSKRGYSRVLWSSSDSPLCRGEGPSHPWVQFSQSWKSPTPEEWRQSH